MQEKNEIVPHTYIKNTSAKIDILADAVDLRNAKVYKFGEKDLITLYNCFSMAIGNKHSVLGFDKRSYYLPIPVTVMKQSIYEYCSEVSAIFLIMTKNRIDEKYSDVFYEITPNIIEKAGFDEMFNEFINRIYHQ